VATEHKKDPGTVIVQEGEKVPRGDIFWAVASNLGKEPGFLFNSLGKKIASSGRGWGEKRPALFETGEKTSNKIPCPRGVFFNHQSKP